MNLDLKKEENIDEFVEGDPLKPFQILNWLAVVGHGASAIAMMSVYEENFSLPTTETYLNWGRINNDTCKGRSFNTTNNGEYCIQPVTDAVCEDCGIDLGWLIIFFHILSFLFQGLAGLTDYVDITELCYGEIWGGYKYDESDDWQTSDEWGEDLDKGCFGYKYSTMVQKSKNPLRFIEYGFSASIMLLSIALINGVTDINLLASIGVLTAACQLCGLVVEYLNDVKLKWILHFNGWLMFLCAYGIIYHAFSKAVNANDVKPPEFVYVIVIVLFLLYASFGMVQFTELLCETRYFNFCFCNFCKKDNGIWCPACRVVKKNRNPRCNPLYKEMVFVTLSLGAKLVLGWLIFFNVLVSQR